MGLFVTISINDTQHNDAMHNSFKCRVSLMLSVTNKPIRLIVIMLNDIMLIAMEPAEPIDILNTFIAHSIEYNFSTDIQIQVILPKV